MVCLLTALCLVFGCVHGLADQEPSQAECRKAFGSRLFAFLRSLNPDNEAAVLEVSLNGAEAGKLTLQRTDGVLDAAGSFQGLGAAELQIGGDAAYLSVNGQTAGLRYAELGPILEALTTRLSALNAQTYKELLFLAVNDVLLPSTRTEYRDGAAHFILDLDGEALSQGLIRLGDHVTESEKYLNALALPWFLYDAQSGGKNADLRLILKESWPEWREYLAGAPLPVALKADFALQEGVYSLEASCTIDNGYTTFTVTLNGAFDGNALNADARIENASGDAMDVSVKGDKAARAFSVIMTSTGGYDMDLILEPTENGWHFLFAGYERGVAQFRAEARLADTAEAFDLYAEAGEKRFSDDIEAYVLTARFDKETKILSAHLNTPTSDTQIDLTGRPGEIGYDLTLVAQSEELVTVEAALNVDQETGNFHGRLENRAAMMTVEWEGGISERAFRFLLTSQYRYQLNGTLEVSGVYGPELVSANFLYTQYGSVSAGSLLWTKEQKALSFAGDSDQYLCLSLSQDASGRPSALRATMLQGRQSYTVLLDEHGLAVDGDGKGFTLTGAFDSEGTLEAISTLRENHRDTRLHWTLSAAGDGLTLAGLTEEGTEVFSAALRKAPKTAFTSLADSENLLDIDAAWVKNALEQMIEGIKYRLLPKSLDY